MQDFRKLKFWEKAHSLTLAIYKETQRFPNEEQYGITNQVHRAAFSIPNNIAEGCGRNSEKKLKRFLTISLGSSSEVEYLLLLSKDLKYLNESMYINLSNQIIEIKKMISGYIRRIKSNI
ncbi:MAG: four helix bundle protein [Candidatus Cloacimonetes bacterium]|nr:four helix bundle protein [Candidatus Cloacimonadota bacterium]